ncbi:hypothetical protein D043_5031B, partial [Vibrio parahaemolyticus EKP-021]
PNATRTENHHGFALQ